MEFANEELLEAAKDIIKAEQEETLLYPGEISYEDLTLEFDIDTYGPASCYHPTLLVLHTLLELCDSGHFDEWFEGQELNEYHGENLLHENYLSWASYLYNKGDYQLGGLVIQQALAHAPGNKTILQMQGLLALGDEEPEAAKVSFDQVIRRSIADNYLDPALNWQLLREKCSDGALQMLQQYEAEQQSRETAAQEAKTKAQQRTQNTNHFHNNASSSSGLSGHQAIALLSILISVIGIIAAVVRYQSQKEKIFRDDPNAYHHFYESVNGAYIDVETWEQIKNGNIPAEVRDARQLTFRTVVLEEFPAFVCDLPQLEQLHFFECTFDSISDSIGKLTNLKFVEFHRCSVSYVPPSMANCTQLQKLIFDDCPLDSLPDMFGGMKDLKHLEVSVYQGVHRNPNARFKRGNALPASVGECRNLELLDFSGWGNTSLPDEWQWLKRLKTVNLCGCGLREIPHWIDQWESLNLLYLVDNQLTDFPESLSKLTRLETIFVKNNPSSASSLRRNAPLGTKVYDF